MAISAIFIFQMRLTAPASADYAFSCNITGQGNVILWLDDHLYCGSLPLFAPETAPLPPFAALTKGEPHHLRVRFLQHGTSAAAATLSVLWSVYGSNTSVPTLIPPSAVGAVSSASPQVARDAMQKKLATGWGSW